MGRVGVWEGYLMAGGLLEVVGFKTGWWPTFSRWSQRRLGIHPRTGWGRYGPAALITGTGAFLVHVFLLDRS